MENQSAKDLKQKIELWRANRIGNARWPENIRREVLEFVHNTRTNSNQASKFLGVGPELIRDWIKRARVKAKVQFKKKFIKLDVVEKSGRSVLEQEKYFLITKSGYQVFVPTLVSLRDLVLSLDQNNAGVQL